MLETMGASATQIKITKEIELAEATTVQEMVALTGRSERYINDLPINVMFIKPENADKQGITYNYTPYDALNIDETISSIERHFGGLSKRHLEVLDLRIGLTRGEPMTVHEVAKFLSSTSNSVMMYYREAISKLRTLLINDGLSNPLMQMVG